MRQKRAKKYRKALKLLQLNFKFREPYQVLIDEEIVLESAAHKYDLVKGIRSVLQGEIKLMITQCAMEALYKTKREDAISLAKTFERRRCGHRPKSDQETTQSAYDCMLGIVSVNGRNKHRYVVATQKIGLRKTLRTVPAVPMVFLEKNVMIMEPLADITTRQIALIEQDKLTSGLNDLNAALKRPAEDDTHEEEEKVKKKRKGPKQPNPLSMKKKKTDTLQPQPQESQETKKRRRTHKKKSEDSD